jgi:hypothetical protein
VSVFLSLRAGFDKDSTIQEKRLKFIPIQEVNYEGVPMVSSDSNPTPKQPADGGSGPAGKYLANLLYLATILFVCGFIWQSIASFILP